MMCCSKRTSYGEWVSSEAPQGSFINTSLCLTGIDTAVSSLTLTTEIGKGEPDLIWNKKTLSLEVDGLQRLLGAGPNRESLSERAVLEIFNQRQEPAPNTAFEVKGML
ncbi:hypothetical protein F5B21DRAFT_458064 [Xylaria acuta]|nr:hypothetical protein F5B21DRAFT_458064 [Xylaria acuta]